MILDTSAIIAILKEEPGHEPFLRRLAGDPVVGVGAPTLAEAGLVLTARLEKDARPLLLRFLQEAQVAVVPFGEDHWRAAVDAYIRFGKGRHAAALNFGDCLTYATARLSGLPLLAAGRDFSKTDLELA